MSLHDMDPEQRDPEPPECSFCHGRGEYQDQGDPHFHSEWMRCERCDGSGWEPHDGPTICAYRVLPPNGVSVGPDWYYLIEGGPSETGPFNSEPAAVAAARDRSSS